VSTPDLSEFEQLSNPKKRPCLIGAGLEGVAADEAAALTAALEADKRMITPGAIVKWLERRGLAANTSSVIHHREGRCTCAHD
jgi:hypothetical protein